MPVELIWPIGSTLSKFSLASVTVINQSIVRVKFTDPPTAVNSTNINDALNRTNWSFTGPDINYATSVATVSGDTYSVDLTMAAALVPGAWTVTAVNVISITSVPLTDPITLPFNYALPSVYPSINQGATNNSNCDTLRRFLNPAIKGKNTDAIISAICYGDSIRTQIAEAAYDQGFLVSASGAYLDRRTANIGIKRPAGVGMNDADLINLAIVIDNQKLTHEAILEALEVYYGESLVKASVFAGADEPYALRDGDELHIEFNDSEYVIIPFETSAFTNIGAATALEVETFINNKLIEIGSKAKAVTNFNGITGGNRIGLYSGKRGLSSSVQIVGGNAQNVFAFPESLFIDLGGSPYETWDIELSDETVGNLVFTTTNSTKYDFNTLLEGDLIYIYGSEFGASDNIGTFAISNIQIYYDSGDLIQSFEISNPSGTASSNLDQLDFESLKFFRPIKNTLYTQLRRVIVSKDANGLKIVIPATTQIVSRTPETGAYSKANEDIEIDTLIRSVDRTVTGITADPHLLTVGDFVFIDGAFSQITGPSTAAGTPSGAFSANLATGISDGSVKTTVSASNTINKIRHKAVTIPNDILMIVGGHIEQDVGGTPISSNTTPCVFDVTSKTTLGDGSLQENYRWKQLTHVLTAGQYDFGASVLNDGRVLVTGGFNGNNLISSPFVPVNGFNVLNYNPTISQNTMVSGTLIETIAAHSQCSLSDGNAIICGGWESQLNWNIPNNHTKKFTAASGLWSSLSDMVVGRMNHETALLPDGNVLAIGGRIPFRRVSVGEDPDTIGYWALDAAPANVTPDLINGNDITISAGVDAISGKGRAGNSFLPGTPTDAHTTAGATQTALNTALLGEWAVECWVLAGATGTFVSNGTAGGGAGNNCLLSFGVAKYTAPNANDGKFFWRWENGTHTEVIQYSTILADTLLTTYESSNQGIWHHVALTKTVAISGTAGLYDVSLYVDGALVQTWVDQANAAGGSTGLFYLAIDPTLATMEQLNTRIDEVRIIEAARTEIDIKNHYLDQCGYTLFDSMDYWNSNYKIGKCLESCEIYDVGGDTWAMTGNMAYAKTGFGVVTLNDGRIMTIGGLGYNPSQSSSAVPLNICEIYDPGSEKWILGPRMPVAREFPVCILRGTEVWVMGGRGVTQIDILNIDTMEWKTSITQTATAPYRSVGGLVDDDTMVICGGAISTTASNIYVAPHLADITSRLGFVIIPGLEEIRSGHLNGFFEITEVPDGTTFKYVTEQSGYASANNTGMTVSKVAAAAAPAGVPGPFAYDLKDGLAVTGTDTTLDMELEEGQQYDLVDVVSTVGFPNESGYLVFNFGFSNQVGPVRYISNISNTKLLIDASFTMPFDLPIGSTVTLLKGRVPFEHAGNVHPGDFWLTPSSSGRIAAQKTLDDIIAAGIEVDIDVVYPDKVGLGGDDRPTTGSPKISDVVYIFGGDDIDEEVQEARDE